ncbi:MAG TPA: hypothetical protein VNA25_26900 [Phycisphaerae bacterium]|nr:hypothetical protein [Phycisphaerae bacterium]
MTPDSQPQQAASRTPTTHYIVAVVAYLAAAWYLVSISIDALNPDGVAYIVNAQHYAAGQFDLAVNGWFGPMLSWLLVPLIWLGVDPILAARLLGVLFGLAFAVGVVAMTRGLGGGRLALLAFVAALLLALRTVAAEITPDFLLAVGLTWYFVLASDLAAAPTARRAFFAGLVGGACYLVKAYAFTFVAAHLVMTFALRGLLLRKASRAPGGLKAFAAAVVGLLVLSAPWIAVVSAQEGALTVSVTARRAPHAWGPLPRNTHWPTYSLQRPREGRLSVWENPAESQGEWPTWHPAGGFAQNLKNQLHVIFLNAIRAAGHLKNADVLGMLMCGWVVAGLLIWPLRRDPSPERMVRLWAWLSVALYLGGYCLLYLYERFTWGAWGVLLALAVSVLSSLRRDEAPRSAPGPRKPEQPAASASRAATAALAAMLIASTAYATLTKGYEYAQSKHEWAQCTWLRGMAQRFGDGTQVASTDWGFGLYFSFWSDSPLLGRLVLQGPGDLDRELSPFGRTLVLVLDSSHMAKLLHQDGRFRILGEMQVHKPSGRVLWAFMYEPRRSSPGGG